MGLRQERKAGNMFLTRELGEATGTYSLNIALVREVRGGEASQARFIREPKWIGELTINHYFCDNLVIRNALNISIGST